MYLLFHKNVYTFYQKPIYVLLKTYIHFKMISKLYLIEKEEITS